MGRAKFQAVNLENFGRISCAAGPHVTQTEQQIQ